jgi:hypothetical protein
MPINITLGAKTAKEARREIKSRWPDYPVNYKGYDKDGDCVLMSLVREKGNTTGVATVKRNRSLPPVSFVAEVPEEAMGKTRESFYAKVDAYFKELGEATMKQCHTVGLVHGRGPSDREDGSPEYWAAYNETWIVSVPTSTR